MISLDSPDCDSFGVQQNTSARLASFKALKKINKVIYDDEIWYKIWVTH